MIGRHCDNSAQDGELLMLRAAMNSIKLSTTKKTGCNL